MSKPPVNDYTLTAPVLRLSDVEERRLTGLTDASPGSRLEVRGSVTFCRDASASCAANRFALPGDQDLPMYAGSNATFEYDPDDLRWHLVDIEHFVVDGFALDIKQVVSSSTPNYWPGVLEAETF